MMAPGNITQGKLGVAVNMLYISHCT